MFVVLDANVGLTIVAGVLDVVVGLAGVVVRSADLKRLGIVGKVGARLAFTPKITLTPLRRGVFFSIVLVSIISSLATDPGLIELGLVVGDGEDIVRWQLSTLEWRPFLVSGDGDRGRRDESISKPIVEALL